MGSDDPVTESLVLADPKETQALLGHRDRNLRIVRDALGVRVAMRGETLILEGSAEDVGLARRLFEDLLQLVRDRGFLRTHEVESAIQSACERRNGSGEAGLDVIAPGMTVFPRTEGQRTYVRALQESELVFCTGPAGAGKTYLAVAAAVSALRAGKVRRIILTRPALEVDEKLGFLPGDMQQKVDPYLRPLYDALEDMMAPEQLKRYIEMDVVEVAPLAYMRGRTLDHSFNILDEGQNCTCRQMRMFLTRLGAHARAVVTGDISQTDLPPAEVSGMVEAMDVLKGVEPVRAIHLDQADIVRHRLVQNIVDAYAARDGRRRPSGTDAVERSPDATAQEEA